jgi:hypothetical protein
MLPIRIALLGLGLVGFATAAEAKVFLSRSEAIELAFPDADRVESRNFVLDDEQARAVESRAHSELPSRLVTIYTGWKQDRVLGHALIDVHTVRTLPEAFLVVISPQGEVRTLRLLAFYEPQEYQPPERWLAQFDHERLSEDLRIQGRIHGIAGSTLSARAVTGGVRRALALYEVLVQARVTNGEG